MVTTAGDPGQARADGADSSFFVDITTVQANVRQPQPQGDASTGTFTVDCGKNENEHFNPDNFIAQPGVRNGAQHLHDYVGNLTTDADSNNQSLQAGGTTCKNGDKSAYFWPVIRIVDEEEAAQDEAEQQDNAEQDNEGQNGQNQGQNNNQGQQQGQGQNNQGQQQGQNNNQRGQQGQNAQQQGQQNRNNGDADQNEQGQNNNRNNLIQGNLAQNQNRDNDQQGNQRGQQEQGQQGNQQGQNNNQQNNNQGQNGQGNNNDQNNNDQQGEDNQQEEEAPELEAPDENNELAGNDGEIQRPADVDLQFRGSPVGDVEAMPKFLRILYGDAKPSTNGKANTKASWTCAGFEDKVLIDKYPICPDGAAVKRIHDFPSCWDGQNIDSENHRDHIAFPNQNGQCGNGFKAVPQLRITLTYNIPQEVQEKRLYKVDSFPEEEHDPLSDHDDFANVMSNQIMNRVVNCINTGKTCNE